MENIENIGAQLLGEIWENGQAANDDFDFEMNGDDDRDGDGTLDGGVAVNPEDGGSNRKTRSSECDLVLYFSCEEALDICAQHPILRPGVVVSIGLDKTTKLSAVFNRYVEFCNENGPRIFPTDLEFVHCQLLNGNDTAEASALMKNDRITVRKVRTAEREAEAEKKRVQRDADRNFFQQMRHLMPDLGGAKTADIILDCRGKSIDESGRNQRVLSTTVRAHSAILSTRCPWLGAIIHKARVEARKHCEIQGANTPDNEDAANSKVESIRRVESDAKSVDDEEDDDIAVLSFSLKDKDDEDEASSGAAEIENDEEDDRPYDKPSPRKHDHHPRPDSPVIVPAGKQQTSRKALLVVTLPNHSPEAVKLLLEYCYTNRVLCLGQEAFVQACKSRPHKHQGPIPPYQNSSNGSRRWPNSGCPLVAFSVALAGISLAEEAGMKRLSLMCEIAASQLVTTSNVVEALSMCTVEKGVSGNDLPRLRKAAMDLILRSGSRGVVELGRSPAFRKALEEQRAVVPTLLQGTMEVVTSYDKTRKRDRTEITYPSFEELDREDSYKRERERRKRRQERRAKDPKKYGDDDLEAELDEFYDPILMQGWGSESTRRALKRMSHHLDAMHSRQAAVFERSRGYSFPTAGRRSSSNRRRGSQT